MVTGKIFWMVLDEVSIPGNTNWLSPGELERYQSFRFDKRKQDWLSGRWVAKKLIFSLLETENSLSMVDITVGNHPAGDPFVTVRGEILNGSLSISHRGEKSAAAFTSIPFTSIGIDLELIEEKSEGFIEDYFTEGETKGVMSFEKVENRDLLASLLWSAKEAMLKAHQIGLRIDTRELELEIPSGESCVGWCPIEILRCPAEMQPMVLYWKQIDHFLITLAIKFTAQGELSSDLIEQVLL
jgi:4'-phosphopantetheinyl transferase